MKQFLLMLLISFSFIDTNAQTIAIKSDSLFVVETACGECKFKMKGSDCELAVRINGLAYFVDGTKIDDHGNAHAADGFCNKIRKATVSGNIVNNRFVATSFTLLPEEKPQQ